MGRSRGGFTAKLHLSADGRCRPVSLIVTPGQRADCTQFKPVLEKIRVPRNGPGRLRKEPDILSADKTYGNGPCRDYLRRGASGTRSRRRPTARSPACAKAHAANGHPASTKSGTRSATSSSGPSTDSSSTGPWPPPVQADARVDPPALQLRGSRSLDLGGHRRPCPAPTRPARGHRSSTPVGEAGSAGQTRTRPRPQRVRSLRTKTGSPAVRQNHPDPAPAARRARRTAAQPPAMTWAESSPPARPTAAPTPKRARIRVELDERQLLGVYRKRILRACLLNGPLKLASPSSPQER